MTALAVETDGEGFLTDPGVWNEEVARNLAGSDGRDLDDEIMRYIQEARRIYDRDGTVPPLRKFCKEMGVSKEDLYKVFQMGPMKLICKWGGLPKPTGCV